MTLQGVRGGVYKPGQFLSRLVSNQREPEPPYPGAVQKEAIERRGYEYHRIPHQVQKTGVESAGIIRRVLRTDNSLGIRKRQLVATAKQSFTTYTDVAQYVAAKAEISCGSQDNIH